MYHLTLTLYLNFAENKNILEGNIREIFQSIDSGNIYV